MADFKTALVALSRGHLPHEVVAGNIHKIIKRHPALAVDILVQLEEAYTDELIDAQTFADFKNYVGEIASEYADDPGRIAAEVRATVARNKTSEESDDIDFDLTVDEPKYDAAEGRQHFEVERASATSWTIENDATRTYAPDEKLGPGSVLKERFQLDEILGVGGMGTVYRGRDLIKVEARDKNPYVALKLLNEDFKHHPDSFIALQREASRQQKLAHPNIATVYDFDRTSGGTFFITMELLEGQPLNTFIKKKVKPRGGLPFEEAFPIIRGLGNALIYAHEREIVHSDLKPGNCFLTKDGTVKVLDFGIARAVSNPGHGESEKTLFDPSKLGALTPAYASTEMLEEKDPDTRDDIYALACVAYELLSGKHPFNKLRATTARDHNLVPATIKGLKRRQMRALIRGLGFTIAERSQSVAEFIDELAGHRSPLHNPLILVPAAAVVIAAAGVFPVINMIEERGISEHIHAVESGDPEQIEAILSKLNDVETDPTVRDRVLVSTRDDLLKYFEAQIDEKIDLSNGRYDFDGARLVISRVEQMPVFADSAQVANWRTEIASTENNLLNQQTELFKDALVYNRLVPMDGDNDVHDALGIIAQFRLDVFETLKSQLPGAYAAAIDRAIVNGEFDGARELNEAGLRLIPEDKQLLDMVDKVDGAEELAVTNASISSYTANMQDASAVANRLNDFLPIQADVINLSTVQPNHPLLASLRTKIEPIADREIERLQANRDWSNSELVRHNYGPLLRTVGLHDQHHAIVALTEAFDEKVEALVSAVTAATANASLSGEQASAIRVVRELESLAPYHPRANDARETVVRWYLKKARIARAERKLDVSDATLDTAETVLQTNASSFKALVAEREINTALRNDTAVHFVQHSTAQTTQLETLSKAFNEGLDAPLTDVANIRQIIESYDEIVAVNPLAPSLEVLRDDLIAKIEQSTSQFASSGMWHKAVVANQLALVYFPEHETFRTNLETYRNAERNARNDLNTRALDSAKLELEAVLVKLESDNQTNSEWNAEVRQALAKLRTLLRKDDEWLSEKHKAVARTYLTKAQSLREAERFSAAANLLRWGAIFSPGLDSFAEEQRKLEADSESFKLKQREFERQARIEGLRQEFETQTQANDTTNATKTLNRLSLELPQDDDFITSIAPQLLAQSYLQLAESSAQSNDYASALRLAKAGLEIQPTNQALRVTVKDLTVRGNSEQLIRTFSEGDEFDLDEALEQINEVKTLDPDAFALSEMSWASSVANTLEQQLRTNGATANATLARAQEVFAGHPEIGALRPAIGVVVAQTADATTISNIRNALKNALLGKARRLIQAAAVDEAHQTEFDELRQTYEERVDAARTLFNEYKSAFSADDFQLADIKIDQALAVWRDNSTFQSEKARTQTKLEELSTNAAQSSDKPSEFSGKSEAPCSRLLAGQGKRQQGLCYDMISPTARGPLMVVVPASETMSFPFAISKFEATVGDFNTYCRVTLACEPLDDRPHDLPITNISIKQATDYAAWLSQVTGNHYQIPSVEQWRYAASANGDQPREDYNCLVKQNGETLKGGNAIETQSGKSNGWGLYNYIGNVQEFAVIGESTVALGGSFADHYSDCNSNLTREHSGEADEITGFRVIQRF